MDNSGAPSPAAPPRGRFVAIAQAALLAGTMDFTAATIHFVARTGREPIRIAWFVASGVFGIDAANAGGWVTAACGVLFHYCIATIWTVFFFLLYPRLAPLRKNAVASGVGYGVFVWTVMNLIVVPLSRAPAIQFNPVQTPIGAAIIVVCIGLPIALLAHRHYARR